MYPSNTQEIVQRSSSASQHQQHDTQPHPVPPQAQPLPSQVEKLLAQLGGLGAAELLQQQQQQHGGNGSVAGSDTQSALYTTAAALAGSVGAASVTSETRVEREELQHELQMLRAETQEAYSLTSELRKRLAGRPLSPGVSTDTMHQLHGRIDLLEEMVRRDQKASLIALEAILAERGNSGAAAAQQPPAVATGAAAERSRFGAVTPPSKAAQGVTTPSWSIAHTSPNPIVSGSGAGQQLHQQQQVRTGLRDMDAVTSQILAASAAHQGGRASSRGASHRGHSAASSQQSTPKLMKAADPRVPMRF